MPRIGQFIRIDAQFDIDVRGERVVFGQFLGHGPRSLRGQSLGFVESDELLEFGFGLFDELASLLGQECLLSVALSAYRDVLAQRHRQCACGESGDTCGQDRPALGGGGCDADDDAGHRDNAVVGAEHTGAQPVEFGVDGTDVRFCGVGL